MAQTFNSPAPSPATNATFDLGTGALSVTGDMTPDQRNSCLNGVQNAAPPTGMDQAATSAWRTQETAKCSGPKTTNMSVADLALTGSLTNYMDLGLEGLDAPTKSPGYPNTWSSTTMTQWPTQGAQAISSGTNLPSLQAWNLKDDQGQLYEVVYTGPSGQSNVLYKSSTTRADHVVSLTPGGSKVDPAPVSAAPAPAVEAEEAPLWLKVSSCCSSFIYCAGIVFLSSMLVPKR